jgi:hypothetical protein
MGANVNAYLSAVGLSGGAVALDVRSSFPQKDFLNGKEVQTESEVERLDLYKVAVVLSVAGVILSLCL